MAKKPKRSKLKVAGIVLLVMMVLGGISPLFGEEEVEKSSEDIQAENEKMKEELAAADEEAKEEETEESTEEVTEEETTEEVTEEESTEEPEKEEEEKEEPAEEKPAKNEDIEHEVIDGVDVYTFTDISSISFKNQLNNFSIKMTDLLSERHNEIENGVVFRTISTLVDNEGNEETVYTAQAYYSQDTVESINYDNWPQLVGEDLYNTADGVMVHHKLSGDTDIQNKSFDAVPEFYRGTIGADYEE